MLLVLLVLLEILSPQTLDQHCYERKRATPARDGEGGYPGNVAAQRAGGV
jgi:hypothetical protein